MMTTFGNKQAAEITGATKRQILSWSEKGLLRATNESDLRSGTKRRYDFENLLELRFAKALFDGGLGFRAAKSIMEQTRGSLMPPHADGSLLIQPTELCFHLVAIDKIVKLVESRMPGKEMK